MEEQSGAVAYFPDGFLSPYLAVVKIYVFYLQCSGSPLPDLIACTFQSSPDCFGQRDISSPPALHENSAPRATFWASIRYLKLTLILWIFDNMFNKFVVDSGLKQAYFDSTRPARTLVSAV